MGISTRLHLPFFPAVTLRWPRTPAFSRLSTHHLLSHTTCLPLAAHARV